MKKTAATLFLSLALGLFWHGGALATDSAEWKHFYDYVEIRMDRHRSANRRNRIRPPAGYSGFDVFIANGELDPITPNPDVPGCFNYYCSGDYYHTEVRGRTLAQVLAIELDAKLFFIQRFGVDVDDPANFGKLFFRRYYRDPRANLNAVLVSGRNVPREGWRVDDGGWEIVFLEDYPLGGEFTGATAAIGSTLNWGEYLITPHGPGARDPIVLSYRSAIPPLIRSSAEGYIRAFQRGLYRGALDDAANDWGNTAFPRQGLDEGIEINPLGMGEVRANARHVLTFSDDGGL